jgi:DNA-binding transcriptional LysR family regulator
MHAAVLRYFCTVARLGSIRRASEELNVASSAISRQIQNLEKDLATQLFERMPGGLRLTPEGKVALEHAERTLLDYDLLRSNLGAMKGVNTGTVTIASLDSLLVNFLPEALIRYHQNNPSVTYRVQSGAHGRVVALVAEGEADIGITFDLARPEDLDFVNDIPMPIMAVMASHHPLAKAETVTLTDCLQYDLLLQFDTQPIRSLIEIELSVLERDGTVLVSSNSLMLLKPMIMAGTGIAFYSPLGMLREIEKGDIRAVPLSGTNLKSLRLGLVIPRRRQLTHATHDMIEYLGSHLEKLAIHSPPGAV